MIQKYQVEVIAIGNGTASKETEMFTAEVLSNLPQQDKERCAYMVVSEAGASVYSASKLAAEEFPQFDLTCGAPSPSPAGFRTLWRSW